MHKACSMSQSIYCFGFCISELASKFSQDLPFCFTCIDAPPVSGAACCQELHGWSSGIREQLSKAVPVDNVCSKSLGMWELEIRGEAPQQGD